MSVIFKLAIKVFQKHSDIDAYNDSIFVFGDKSSFEYKKSLIQKESSFHLRLILAEFMPRLFMWKKDSNN